MAGKRKSLDDLVKEFEPPEDVEVPRRVAAPDLGTGASAAGEASGQAGSAAGRAGRPRAASSDRTARGKAPGQRPRARAQNPELTEPQSPKWRGLERKELRLRPGQLDELARLRR